MKRLLFCLILGLSLLDATAQQTQTQSRPSAPPRTGWMRIQMPELPTPEIRPQWFPYGFDPAKEVFEIYIPPDRPEEPFGVLGWTNPQTAAGTPRRFEPLLKEYHLIAISAENCGNDQGFPRRIGLLVSALLQLEKSISIDRQRLILSGFSGGGRTSATGCFVHPELWRGAISWAGGSYYKSYSVPIPVGASSPGINDHVRNGVTKEQVKLARENSRFVLITGPKDFNLNDSRGIHRALRGDGFQSLLIEEPGMGHEVGSVDSMRKALEFVFTKDRQPYLAVLRGR